MGGSNEVSHTPRLCLVLVFLRDLTYHRDKVQFTEWWGMMKSTVSVAVFMPGGDRAPGSHANG